MGAVTFVDQLNNVESSGISLKNTSFTSHKAAFDYSVINGYNHLCVQRNASQIVHVLHKFTQIHWLN